MNVPGICYRDDVTGNLVFRRSKDPTGTTWESPVTIDANGVVNVTPSLAIVEGHPAVAYYSSATVVKYCRANDSKGVTWDVPVTVATTTGSPFRGLHLIVADGNPAIGYFGDAFGVYARADDSIGTTWTGYGIIANQAYDSMSLTIIAGRPAISWVDYSNGGLRYRRANNAAGTSWGSTYSLDTTNPTTGFNSSLTTIDGNPAVAYRDLDPITSITSLKYIRATDTVGSTWGSPVTIEASGIPGPGCSLASINGKPGIAYYKNAVGFRLALEVSPGNWSTFAIDANAGSGDGRQITLSTIYGYPGVSYNYNSTNLKYSRSSNVDGTSWQTPVSVDLNGGLNFLGVLLFSPPEGFGGLQYYPSIADALSYTNVLGGTNFGDYTIGNVSYGSIDQFTKWRIAPNSAGSSSTTLAYSNGTTLNSDGNGAYYFLYKSLSVDVPAISYYDGTAGSLKFIRGKVPTGNPWNTAQTVQTGGLGTLTCMQIVNGNPAIVYRGSGSDINFIRALDPYGTSWSSPVLLDTSIGIHPLFSNLFLAVVGGHPAVAYKNTNTGVLKFIRANDINGTTWGSPIVVTSGMRSGWISLVVVNGKPAISYDIDTNNVYYIRATDSIGSFWGSPVLAGPGGAEFTSMAIVNGNPAIAYRDINSGIAYFVRSNDQNGDTWGTPIAVGNGAYWVSMTIVNGNPAISYVTGPGFLNFVRATNSNGTSWASPYALESGSAYSSLAVLNGYPAISYSNSSVLKFVIATSPDGSSWDAPQTLDSATTGAYCFMTNLNVIPPIQYYETNQNALTNNNSIGWNDYGVYTIGNPIYGNINTEIFNSWKIASTSNGSSSQLIFYKNNQILSSDGNNAYYFLYYEFPCFLEGTKILCLVEGKEKYVEIQNLRKGDLVKTRLNGYKKLEMVGSRKITNIGTPERKQDRLYRLSKEKYPELTEDLFITGCHSILVPKLTDEEREETKKQMRKIYVTENRYRLMACIDQRAEPWLSEGEYTIWHFALEHKDEGMNYGTYVNGGLLAETCSLKDMKYRMSGKQS